MFLYVHLRLSCMLCVKLHREHIFSEMNRTRKISCVKMSAEYKLKENETVRVSG